MQHKKINFEVGLEPYVTIKPSDVKNVQGLQSSSLAEGKNPM